MYSKKGTKLAFKLTEIPEPHNKYKKTYKYNFMHMYKGGYMASPDSSVWPHVESTRT